MIWLPAGESAIPARSSNILPLSTLPRVEESEQRRFYPEERCSEEGE